ncbi:hypothetical protein AZE42_13494 [Rhizopogon vesiculosus]|uniref:Uncharacterized protein n=1 Tax=Rhizopogon vesiculosus TaxID=180088 RepID=A0A1J8QTX6_9AGAM|nr:hypothetical protein AZE42_13494 [Rhizopogon vesiculosus]
MQLAHLLLPCGRGNFKSISTSTSSDEPNLGKCKATAQGMHFQLLTVTLHVQNLEISANRGQLHTMPIKLS